MDSWLTFLIWREQQQAIWNCQTVDQTCRISSTSSKQSRPIRDEWYGTQGSILFHSSFFFLPLFRSASAIGYRTFGANDMIRRRNKYIPVWRRILFFAVWVQQGQTVLLSLGLSVCWAHTATETKLALIDSRYRPFTWIDSSLSTFFQVFHWYILYRIRESSRYISSRVLTLIKFILAPSGQLQFTWIEKLIKTYCWFSFVFVRSLSIFMIQL